ncbi:MAG: hypothetical protein A2015_02775 [Spirochaetes bacterium GWF1_31_7]|nr:MAG: hypothetical protein A2Y30_15820 [Spirochaetes bacterium GWE1_32_154]OHD47113.1 MAG: hypothetical protein A2015_02775 [Spirochaetes bacterium GWF1_31_7]OHD52004.1 MAG: hypothetical protein A2Y29_14905 [Spirochaetes bacterium GWE2_31_10]HBI38281.1 hypothetical protein [Spirochaetia bacterium]
MKRITIISIFFIIIGVVNITMYALYEHSYSRSKLNIERKIENSSELISNEDEKISITRTVFRWIAYLSGVLIFISILIIQVIYLVPFLFRKFKDIFFNVC